MNVKDLRTLVDNLDEYIHVPGGIGRLKKTILHLAVSGQLVTQDPSGGTGQDLYHQIQAEKMKLIAEGYIKKQKALPEITSIEVPFEIPKSWKWARLGDIGHVGTGATPSRDEHSYYGGDIPWVTSALTSQELIVDSVEHITQKAIDDTNCSIYPKNSLVIAMYGQGKTRGQVAKLGIAAATNQACAVFENVTTYNLNEDYVMKVLEYSYDLMRDEASGGAQPNLNVQKIKNITIPLPSVEEQQRIMSKLSSIYAVISDLDDRYRDEQKERRKLVISSLSLLATSSDPLALDRLAEIIRTKKDVVELRKAILHLAVSGQLVQQDPSEGTGEELYRQIQAQKVKFVVEGKIKKQKPLTAITDDEINFDIPDSWKWVRLPAIYNSITPASKIKTSEILARGDNPVVDQGQSFIAGYTNSSKLTNVIHPVVVFGDHTREVKLIDFSFVAGADGVKILDPLLINSEYFYLLVRAFKPQTRGYGRHFRMLNQQIVPICPVIEQVRIVQKTNQLLDLVTQLESLLVKE